MNPTLKFTMASLGLVLLGMSLGELAMRHARTKSHPITYTIKTPVWETTNAIEIIPDHEHAIPPCTLIRYVENGVTNEFHAWACPVEVWTNVWQSNVPGKARTPDFKPPGRP